MLLVAGGYYTDYYYYYDSESDPSAKDHYYYYYSTDYYSPSNSLLSTEILLPGYSYWTYAASLPVPVAYTASVSLHNIIYLIG